MLASMPIAFRDAEDIEALGLAGYLVLRAALGDTDYTGALFVINARGEPREFTYSRLTVPHQTLWRPGDARRYIERALISALFDACPRDPILVLARAEDVLPEVFARDLIVGVPVVRIAPRALPESDPAERSARYALSWYPAAPAPHSPARRLVDELTARLLLVEPFERAERGLDEVDGGEG